MVTAAPKAGDSEVLAAIGRLDARLVGEHRDNTAIMQEVKAQLERINKAFPGGDFDRHLRYHEALIRKEEKRQKMYDEMLGHVAKASAWSALVGVGYVLLKFGKDWILTVVKAAL